MQDQANDSLIQELIQDEENFNEEINPQDEPTPEPQAQGTETISKDEPQEPEESEPLKLDKNFVEEYGLPKTFIGKPIEELGKSYKQLLSEFTRKSQKLSEIERSERTGKLKEEYSEIAKNLPDNIDSPEDFATAILSEVDRIAELKYQQLAEQQKTSGDAVEMVITEIKQQLPGVDVTELIDNYKTAKADKVDVMVEVYSKHPELLVDDLVTYYKSLNPDNNAINQKVSAEVKRKLRETETLKSDKGLAKVKSQPTQKEDSLISELLADEEAIYYSQQYPV